MEGNQKQKEEGIVVEGVVKDVQRGNFRVEIVPEGEQPKPEQPGLIITAHLAGRLRKNWIRIVQGDRVKVEISMYDPEKGRIIYRMK